MGHEQAKASPSRQQIDKIIEFESQVYMAAAGAHIFGGPLADRTGLRAGSGRAARSQSRRARRQRARSRFRALQFVERQRLLPGLGRARRRYLHVPPILAARRHAHQLDRPGQSVEAHLRDLPQRADDRAGSVGGLGRCRHHELPDLDRTARGRESSELPVFKITCCDRMRIRILTLGRVIYTTDPGRALISGRCVDVGSIVMQQLRGLAARAPYFANGSAKTLREVVDFYDRRFDMKLTDQRKGRPDQFPRGFVSAAGVLSWLPGRGAGCCSASSGISSACPIVRDTRTVPCFLAEYDGETYFLGIQQDITADFHPPQLKHEVLVEGRSRPARASAAAFRCSRFPFPC